MNRRELLRLGAVGSVTFAFGGIKPLGGDPAVAQMSAPPTVDGLVLTNVVDNVYDAFARGGRLDTITVQRAALDPKGLLLFEHGLAYHLESVRGGERREILLDFAATEVSLLNNYGLLKVEPMRADALIVSHGHFDHYGALPDLARVAQGKLKPGITLYAGGEDTFCHRVVVTPGGSVDYGTLDDVKDRGLVVITSCGHAGVINSVRHAQKVSGIQKVHAIVGGFHLAPAPDEIVAKTVTAFKDINPDYIIPMHCSGMNMIMAVHMAMPKTLVMPSTGTRIVFGA